MATSTYPVRVDAHLDASLNRWLWLVKWLLAIPHYIVLAFLWVAFTVLSIIAFFAILFTGRYPHAIFDFNVGVLRWSWRVAYYAYGALGTDRYPPFTLAEVPDYPAHLDVAYPDHLSRGLVLVKWWLLAIPHYIVVGLLVGTGAWWIYSANGDAAGGQLTWGGGLIGLLVLVAAVVLLFTGRYPQSIFDLVLGLNRWVLRVAAYAGLMTDDYPPFRLDMGGDDPNGAVTMGVRPDAPAGTTATGPDVQAFTAGPTSNPAGPAPGAAGTTTGVEQGAPPPPGPEAPPGQPGRPGSGTGWGAGRVIAVIVGALIVLASLGSLAAGAAMGAIGAAARDDDGFLMSGDLSMTTSTHALVSPSVRLHGGAEDVLPESVLGDARIQVESTSTEPVLVGIAPTADVNAYLSGVSHATLVDVDGFAGINEHAVLENTSGGAPSSAPTDQDFWVKAVAGSGPQSIEWPIESGDWTVVVMNADGSTNVDVDVAAGATVPAFGWVVGGLLIGGAVGLLVGGVILFIALSTRSRPATTG